MKICPLFVILTAAFVPLCGQADFLPPGHRPLPPGVHALKGATVVIRPGKTLSSATILIRDGRIEAVFEQGEMPVDARHWNLMGKTVYAGFIDPYTVVGKSLKPVVNRMTQPIDSSTQAANGGRGFLGLPGEELDPGLPGPGPRLSSVRADRRMALQFKVDSGLFELMRKVGFTAANLAPATGIIRGTSALVSLRADDPGRLVIRPEVFQHVVFDTRAAEQEEFPRSLMGVIAAVRQSFFDARHQAKLREYQAGHPDDPLAFDFNPALAALQPSLQGMTGVLIEPGSVLMVDRARHVARELGLRHWVVASGHEWRRPDLIQGAAEGFIVPLVFPAISKMPSESDWETVSLDGLRAWDWAPDNPRTILEAGNKMALTTHGLSKRDRFRANVSLAVRRGLKKENALSALTTVPAKFCGVEKELGTIEPGKLASLLVVDGDYFDEKAKIEGVWVEGHWYPSDKSRLAWQSKKKNEKKDKKKKASPPKKEAEKLRDTLTARSPRMNQTVFRPSAVLVRNVTLWTCGSAGTLRNADLLVDRGRVRAVGRDLKVPDEVKQVHIIDATGRHVTPGLVDAHSHSMILGMVNEGTLPSSAMVRIADVINSESVNIHRQLAGGLTVANLLHGSANPIGGQNAVIKLRLGEGPEGLLFKAAPQGIKFALGENVKQSNWGDNKTTRFPQTRMGVPTFHANRFTAAQQYLRQWREYERNGGSPPRRNLELEALGEIIRAKRWIHCHSYRQDEILALLRTMEQFGIQVGTLQHVLEGYKVADEIAAHGAGASCFSDWWAYKYEVIDAIPYAGSLMHDRGALVSFNSDSSDLARRMNLEAAKAVKYGGTPEIEALKFVTLNPAIQLRVGHRIGSLEPGKDGDFVIWSGPPLSTGSICLQTWIEGSRYFERRQGLAYADQLKSERDRLLAKARKILDIKKEEKKDDEKSPSPGHIAYFLQAIETAHGLGVSECFDCQMPRN